MCTIYCFSSNIDFTRALKSSEEFEKGGRDMTFSAFFGGGERVTLEEYIRWLLMT